MFRRIAIPLICLAALVVSIAGWVWFRYLRDPGMSALPTHVDTEKLRVRPPTDAFCQRESRGDYLGSRVILVRLNTKNEDAAPAITINKEEPLGWPRATQLLHDIYAVRAERVAFLESDSGVGMRYVGEMVIILRHAGVTDICLVDPAMPPEIPLYPQGAS